jgi:predicted acetyltransferase
MFNVLASVIGAALSFFKTQRELALENLALRHQIGVLKRTLGTRRIRLKPCDRKLWTTLFGIWSGWQQALANLLELYLHDLSAAFPIQLGADGRFGYQWLPLYWTEPERRFPFLIREAGRVVGFVLVTRGSPASDDPDVLDVAEFFVLRQQRRTGVGRRAAVRLWNQLPGRWIVRASEGMPGAVPFWTSVIAEYTDGAAIQSQRQGNPHLVRVLSFESPGLGPARG